MRLKMAWAVLSAALILVPWSPPAGGASLNWEGTATAHLYPEDYVNAKFRGGGVATVNGSSGEIPYHLDEIRLGKNRGLIGGSHTHLVTDPDTAAFGLAAIRYVDVEGMTGTIGGSFAEGRSPGPMPVRGIVHVCLLTEECTSYAAMPLTQPTTVNGIPGSGVRGLGVGGLLTIGGYGGIRISVQMAPWTIKTVAGQNAVETEDGGEVNSSWTMAGFAHGPASGSSSTAAPGGFIKLVTPAQVATNMPIGFGHPSGRVAGTIGSVISLSIRFIPEPGALAGLGACLSFLALICHNRMRR